MAEPAQSHEATELVYLPRPSWAPALLAFAVFAIVNGIYAEGILLRGWCYMVGGAILAVLVLRWIARSTARDLYQRPRRQRASTAVLPAASLKAPPKSD
jgi:ABC-type phosphate transport system permease subunit